MCMQQKEYRKSAFAFLDVLGVRKKIENDNGVLLNKISEIYKSIIRIKESVPFVINYQIFSDNIVLEIPIVSEDGICELAYLIEFVADIQYECLQAKLLIRGGITVDDAYVDENFVFGKALVSTYKAESYEAIYPRVLIKKELVKQLSKYMAKKRIDFRYCKKDEDGAHFVDYLQAKNITIDLRLTCIENALEQNAKEMEIFEGDTKVMQNLLWHQRYLMWSKENHS